MADYRVLFGSLINNDILGEIEVHDLKYSDLLAPPGRMSCWVSMDDKKCTRDNLDPGATAMYVERGGLLVWGGILWTARATSTTRKLDLECFDFWSYFRKRRLRATKNYPFADQLMIVRDIINYAQAQPGGDIGVIVGGEVSLIPRTQQYFHYERHEIARICEDLSALENGFDISIQVQWNGTTPQKNLRLWYPQRGSRREGLVFNHNIQGISEFEDDVDATTLATVIDAIGSGDGDKMLIATAVDYSNLGRYPLYEDTISLKDQKDFGALQAAANEAIRWRVVPDEVPAIEKDPNIWPDFGSFQVGDEGVVVARDQGNWLNLYGYHRILGWEVSRNDNGKENQKIDMVKVL